MNGELPVTAAAAAEAVSAVSAATAFRHIDAARASAEWVFRVLGVVFLALFIAQPPRNDSLALTKTSTTKSSSSSKGSTKGYCQACQAASLALRRPASGDRRRRSKAIDPGVLPFIFCAGCGSEHRAHLFSAEERRRSDDARICAGREGRVRLCEHVSFGWEEARRRSGKARDRPAILECQHGSHRGPASATPGEQTCEDKSVPRAEFWRGKSGNVIVRLVLEVHMNATRYRSNDTTKGPADGAVRSRLEEAIGPALSTWWPDCGRNKRLDPVELLNPARDRAVRGHEEVWYSHDGGSQFLVSLGRCPRGADTDGVVIRLERTLVMQYGPWEAQWRSTLDPWSWRQSEDVEMEGLSWCSEAECRSHEDEMRAGRCGLRPEDLNRSARGQLLLMPKIRVRARC